jgi:hypothetical protein
MPDHAYLVEFTDPGDEFSFPGTSSTTVLASSPEQAEIKANVWYYGETVPTVTPKHEVRIILL